MKFAILFLILTPALAHADDITPVCNRTAPVNAFLETATSKTCDQITAADLLTIPRVAVPGAKITEFQAGDFSGLTNLVTLNIQGNPFTTLTPGLLDDLPNLQTLVIFRTGLTAIPDDFLAKNPSIQNLYMFGDKFTSLPDAVIARFETYTHWVNLELDRSLDDASGGQLTKIFAAKGASLVLDGN